MSCAGRQAGARCRRPAQNGAQAKIYKSFTSGVFLLIFSDRGWPRGTKTPKGEAADKEGRVGSLSHHPAVSHSVDEQQNDRKES